MSRLRTNVDPTSTSQGTHSYSWDPSLDTTFSFTSSFRSRSMTDEVTLNYAKRVREGEIINNPCDYEEAKGTMNGGGKVTFREHWYPAGLYRTVTGSPCRYFLSILSPTAVFPRDLFGTVSSTSQFKALANVDQTPYEMIEDIGEIKETLGFLRSPFSSIYALSSQFNKEGRRVARRRGITLPKALAGLWLTWRFAFLPLVRSTINVMEGLATGDRTSKTRRISRGFFSVSEKVSEDVVSGSAHSEQVFTHIIEDSSGVIYEVSNPVNGLRYTFGLRLKDLPVGLWQLVPLSFMIDRFFDISSMIRGLTAIADPSVEFLAGFTVRKDSRDVRVTFTDHDFYEILSLDSDEVFNKHFEYIRTPWIPSVEDTLPPIDIGGLVSSATRITDLIALIIQNLRGH